MVKFEFYLSEEDFNRLYEIKDQQGKQYMTGNDFARQLLEEKIYMLYSHLVNTHNYEGRDIN